MAETRLTLGQYELIECLGRGGAGEVFKAYQPGLGRHVAIKTLVAGPFASQEFLDRFENEAHVLGQLRHPNIVQLYDFGVADGMPYLVMELIDGWSVADLVLQHRLDPEKSLRIAYAVARALEAAHDLWVIHGDIKPENVRVDRRGRVRVLDFGMTRQLSFGRNTCAEPIGGTPAYMAPELATKGAPIDGRADVYSLGAMLYEMLTGRPPFSGTNLMAILHQQETSEPAPPGVSAAVDALVLKALARDPWNRFQSARELAESIRAIGRYASSTASPAITPKPTTPARHRAAAAPSSRSARKLRKLPLLAAALACAAMTGVAAFVVWHPESAIAPTDTDQEGDAWTAMANAAEHVLSNRFDRARADLAELLRHAGDSTAEKTAALAGLLARARYFGAARIAAERARAELSADASASQRCSVLRSVHAVLARSATRRSDALQHLREALALGATVAELRGGAYASDAHRDPGFAELLGTGR